MIIIHSYKSTVYFEYKLLNSSSASNSKMLVHIGHGNWFSEEPFNFQIDCYITAFPQNTRTSCVPLKGVVKI